MVIKTIFIRRFPRIESTKRRNQGNNLNLQKRERRKCLSVWIAYKEPLSIGEVFKLSKWRKSIRNFFTWKFGQLGQLSGNKIEWTWDNKTKSRRYWNKQKAQRLVFKRNLGHWNGSVKRKQFTLRFSQNFNQALVHASRQTKRRSPIIHLHLADTDASEIRKN